MATPDMEELGSSGLRRAGGFIAEEFLPALRNPRGWRVWREMSDNDPVIGSILFAIEKVITRLEWKVEAGSKDPADALAAEFVQSCIEDMSDSFQETVSSVLSMLPYGYSYHEIVYKIRGGESEDSSRRSKFTDGKIGWRKWAVRSQETLFKWELDPKGGIQGFHQMDPSGGQMAYIPIEKALLFRTKSNKNNPEGVSILRNAYRPWYYKKRIEEIEAVGIERDLAGLPIAFVPPELLMSTATPAQKAQLAAITTIVQGIKRNEQEGVVFPMIYDEGGHKTYDLQLLTSGGSRQFDTDKIVARYNQQIAMTVLADFILLGHEQTGSYSLGASKIDLWTITVDSIAKSIADIINTHAVPRLLRLNGMQVTSLPYLTYGDVAPTDLTEMADFIQKTIASGALMADASLEAYLRDLANLPVADEADRTYTMPKVGTATSGTDESVEE
jgi:hypothetical protein